MPKPPASPKAHPQHGKHDHRACIARAVAKAEALCRDRGVRLTELRRRVLELVWRAHEPIGAYGVLELLRTENDSAAPPTVYRALDFLVEQGLVHRVESAMPTSAASGRKSPTSASIWSAAPAARPPN